MANNFITDPEKVSFSSILTSLTSYVGSLPDAAKWKDFFESSTGLTLLDLMASMQAFFAYQVVVGRRESYLPYANLVSSNIGIAESLGYSTGRGNNAKLTLTITPSSNISLSAFTVVGSVKNFDIVLASDVNLLVGVSTTVDVILGDLKTEVQSINTSNLTVFKFLSSKVSEDIKLNLSSLPGDLPVSENILDLNNDKYVGLSNAFGAVNFFYLNTDSSAAYGYISGDSLTLTYVELNNISYLASDIKFNYGTVDSTVVVSSFQAKETNDSIKINAPLQHETLLVIRGRNDFKKILKLINSSFIDTGAIDVSPAIVELTYLKNDQTLLDSVENSEALTAINTYRPFGVQQALMSDPVKVDYNLSIAITLSNLATLVSTVETDVDTILNAIAKDLGNTLDLEALEESIEKLTYVKIARITVVTAVYPVWSTLRAYRLSEHVIQTASDPSLFFECTTSGTSGASEPTWPTVVGDTVTDGTVVWTARGLTDAKQVLGWNEYIIFSRTITVS